MRSFRLGALGLAAVAAACAGSAPASSGPVGTVPAAPTGSDAGLTPRDLAPAARAQPASPSDAAAEAEATPLAEELDASPSTGRATMTSLGAAPTSPAACNEQSPQGFLVRSNFLKGGQEAMQRAVQYRTDEYGYFHGFGRPGANAQPPGSYVISTTFMGLPIKMHRKVVPALQCVEDEINRACTAPRYTPHALAGIRFRNTYRGGEVTNHIYGIAIDIDPGLNTCCGCVKPWNDAPACRRPAKSEYDRMAMPECWVHAFERYGFYWLGHDVLRDTMHFEFLGDPERILGPAPAQPAHVDGDT